jgi:anti-sigma factor RsiW
MNRHKFKELVDALLEGELSEAEFLELEAELTVDPELRREYLDRIALTR